MGLGGLLRGLAKYGKFIPGPQQPFVAGADIAFQGYDALKNRNKNKSSQVNAMGTEVNPETEIGNMYRDPRMKQFLDSLNTNISDTKGRNQHMFDTTLLPGYSEFAGASGGFSPNYEKYISEAGDWWGDPRLDKMADTGGVDDLGKSRMRGAGVFDEFAKTGGYRPNDILRMRQQATAPVTALYANMKRTMGQRNRASGGSPGFSASDAEMARESARASSAAALEGETNITNNVREGRMWGGTNIASSEGNLQELLTRNMMQAMGMRTNAHQAGLGMALGAEQNRTQNRLSGLQGVANLRTEVPSDVKMLDQQLRGIGMDFDSRLDLIKTEMIRRNGPGWWEKYGKDILGGLIAGAGIAQKAGLFGDGKGAPADD